MVSACLRAVAVAVTLTACSSDNLDKPANFFERNRIGSSTDYAVVKWGNDHVATVHGFGDDLEGCQIMVSGLNVDACAETNGRDCLKPFSCKPLN
jgi:hypothetical protein